MSKSKCSRGGKQQLDGYFGVSRRTLRGSFEQARESYESEKSSIEMLGDCQNVMFTFRQMAEYVGAMRALLPLIDGPTEEMKQYVRDAEEHLFKVGHNKVWRNCTIQAVREAAGRDSSAEKYLNDMWAVSHRSEALDKLPISDAMNRAFSAKDMESLAWRIKKTHAELSLQSATPDEEQYTWLMEFENGSFGVLRMAYTADADWRWHGVGQDSFETPTVHYFSTLTEAEASLVDWERDAYVRATGRTPHVPHITEFPTL